MVSFITRNQGRGYGAGKTRTRLRGPSGYTRAFVAISRSRSVVPRRPARHSRQRDTVAAAAEHSFLDAVDLPPGQLADLEELELLARRPHPTGK
jgi:hypothetical protein